MTRAARATIRAADGVEAGTSERDRVLGQHHLDPARASGRGGRVAAGPAGLRRKGRAPTRNESGHPGLRVPVLAEHGRGRLRAALPVPIASATAREPTPRQHDRPARHRRKHVLRRLHVRLPDERAVPGVQVRQHDGADDQPDDEHHSGAQKDVLCSSTPSRTLARGEIDPHEGSARSGSER